VLPRVENDYIEHAPQLSDHRVMLVACDENKSFDSNFELLQFIVLVEQLQLHFNRFELEPLAGLKLVRYEHLKQPQRKVSMVEFSAFPFMQQAKQYGRS